MTWTRWTPGGRLARTDPRPPDAVEGQPNGTLLPALTLGGLAAVLLALGSSIPVVAGASPGYTSAPLLIVLAVLPFALALFFLGRGRPVAAVGVFAGAAALAPGRFVLDLQFLVDPSSAARPELYRPEVFEVAAPSTGLWLLLAGHVATAAAGVLALRAIGPRGEPAGRGLLLAGVVAGGIAAIGVMMAPFSTDDAFLPVGSAFESTGIVLAGSLLVAFALPAGAALLVSSGARGVTLGGLLGLALAALAIGLPNLVTGLAVTNVSLTAGPIVVLVGVAGLILVAFLPGEGPVVEVAEDEAGEASLPGSSKLRVATGVLALLTMIAAIIGSVTDQVIIAGGLSGPASPSRSLLLISGLLLGVLGLAMFVPAFALRVRPVISVVWAGVPLAATAVLTTAITATELGAGLEPGQGAVWTAVAAVGAIATACCSVVTGMVERDDSDDTAEVVPGPNLMTPLVAGGILAVGGFGTPSIVAPDYTEPALWSNFGTPSWGLLVALLTVLGACFLAPRSRPGQATGLLAGATLLAVLRVLQLPLASGEITGSHAGVGWWLALGCVVALAIAAALAPRGAFHSPKTRSGSIR
ncbi:hypothetical protein FPZ12_044630 [Amycolatopsis acidicola]|uniref:Uncharacterized protein n=1 Tax=Amycolatopsis acidicola TaxID=2596893 RepID=A0A5N0UPD9_9PSEU|nr:hypothetical protein [Amycolatopsis acidicola]KAA9148683.1 hypothetical protein FPZ12_044630 [Amycolatopsis acidicola]